MAADDDLAPVALGRLHDGRRSSISTFIPQPRAKPTVESGMNWKWFVMVGFVSQPR